MDEAVASLGRAIALRPANTMARWQLVMAQLPIIYRSESEIDERRAAYRAGAREAGAGMPDRQPHSLAEAAKAVGSAQPFFLAYQGRSDRELQAIHGALAARIMAAFLPAYAERPPMPDRPLAAPIRVGILSGFFHGHSNWKIPIRGWVENLPRDRFQLFGYYTQNKVDRTTPEARKSFTKFVEGPRSLEAWCAAIRADRLHILIIPETGMDPTTMKLASLRLAPVQATSWGHPNTSGLPTIDYFLSSDLMEPRDGQDTLHRDAGAAAQARHKLRAAEPAEDDRHARRARALARPKSSTGPASRCSNTCRATMGSFPRSRRRFRRRASSSSPMPAPR